LSKEENDRLKASF
jgi:calcium-dependent protein kinase